MADEVDTRKPLLRGEPPQEGGERDPGVVDATDGVDRHLGRQHDGHLGEALPPGILADLSRADAGGGGEDTDAAVEQVSGTVIVVAHGGLNRFLLGHWLGMPPERAIAIEQNFACVNVVEFVGSGRPWVRAVNVTLHDPLKLEARGF